MSSNESEFVTSMDGSTQYVQHYIVSRETVCCDHRVFNDRGGSVRVLLLGVDARAAAKAFVGPTTACYDLSVSCHSVTCLCMPLMEPCASPCLTRLIDTD